ncbi:resolvase-like protein [Anaerobacterium chartisolvens]|uniref:Resolvase-like protein n=1 Tax=Anaerobacterium chartisolvens TaxID=1297424 RepID=A0A369BC50_9FIRM|nr:recombinase family protein [Anaerobacterium chartisolvens]RCX17234.1 resolvase-like protein [Anaerobacterium chartisolvens]
MANTKPINKTATIYVRVSTEEQAREGYSIPAQIEVLSQYCRLYNINIYKVYKDLGISGKPTANRHDLQQLLEDSEKGLLESFVTAYVTT